MGVNLEPHEIDEYMQTQPRAILCVSRAGKAPFAVPMWFAWMDGKVVMHTLLASKKVDYIRANPLVTCVVESGEHYFTLKAVLLMGTCEVIDDQDLVRAEIDRMKEVKPLYNNLRPDQWPSHLERHYAKPRALLRVTPHSITSWDFKKIRT
jgi:nitroimidazol reductase NimA-like FMN-containing flavoprotein (pyridoxamine 5'-phosphate oxidase superfamily)